MGTQTQQPLTTQPPPSWASTCRGWIQLVSPSWGWGGVRCYVMLQLPLWPAQQSAAWRPLAMLEFSSYIVCIIFQIDKNIRKSPHNVSVIGLQSLPDVLQHPVVQCVQLYHIMYHIFPRRSYNVMWGNVHRCHYCSIPMINCVHYYLVNISIIKICLVKTFFGILSVSSFITCAIEVYCKSTRLRSRYRSIAA